MLTRVYFCTCEDETFIPCESHSHFTRQIVSHFCGEELVWAFQPCLHKQVSSLMDTHVYWLWFTSHPHMHNTCLVCMRMPWEIVLAFCMACLVLHIIKQQGFSPRYDYKARGNMHTIIWIPFDPSSDMSRCFLFFLSFSTHSRNV